MWCGLQEYASGRWIAWPGREKPKLCEAPPDANQNIEGESNEVAEEVVISCEQSSSDSDVDETEVKDYSVLNLKACQREICREPEF